MKWKMKNALLLHFPKKPVILPPEILITKHQP